MNDVSGTTVVDSMETSNGTSQRDTSLMTVAGKIGTALTFNGSSDYINTNSTFQSTFQNSFSVNLWCKVTDGQSVEQFLWGAQNAPATMIAELYIQSNGTLSFLSLAAGNQGAELDHQTFSSGQNDWKMVTVVATYLSERYSDFVFYINGSWAAETGSVQMGLADYLSSMKVYLGGLNWNNTLTEPFTGALDNVAIFNKALSTDEIAFLWNNGNGTEDLVESGVYMDDFLQPAWGW
jgi:hypothetical protein